MAESSWVVADEDVDGFMMYIDIIYMTTIHTKGN